MSVKVILSNLQVMEHTYVVVAYDDAPWQLLETVRPTTDQLTFAFDENTQALVIDAQYRVKHIELTDPVQGTYRLENHAFVDSYLIHGDLGAGVLVDHYCGSPMPTGHVQSGRSYFAIEKQHSFTLKLVYDLVTSSQLSGPRDTKTIAVTLQDLPVLEHPVIPFAADPAFPWDVTVKQIANSITFTFNQSRSTLIINEQYSVQAIVWHAEDNLLMQDPDAQPSQDLTARMFVEQYLLPGTLHPVDAEGNPTGINVEQWLTGLMPMDAPDRQPSHFIIRKPNCFGITLTYDMVSSTSLASARA